MRPETARVDAWLRREGLPTLVPRRRRGTHLIWRTTPFVFVVGAALALLFAVGLGQAFFGLDHLAGAESDILGSDRDLPVVIAVLGFLAFVALISPSVAAWVSGRRMHRWSTTGRWVATALAWGYLWVEMLTTSQTVLGATGLTVAIIAAAHVLVWVGAVAVGAWSLRWAWSSLGALQTMTSRALPLIVSVILIAFYSTEPWQVSDAMSTAQRWSMIVVVAVIAALAIWPIARTEVDAARTQLTEARRAELLAGTPLAGTQHRLDTDHDLSSSQRINVIGLLVLAQVIQAGLFLLTMAGLLSVLGRLTISDTVVAAWSGRARDPWFIPGTSATLPIDHQTVRVAIFLATIAALTFVLSSLFDPGYRGHFFEPVVERLRLAVAAHAALTAYDEGSGDSPEDPPKVPPDLQ
ncbi:MAG: hypothetical protein IPL94_06840 [Tetrasphaera sp.]|nr:hypothetical protein [Tetrasphaera sp.]